ncbi:MAG: DUF4388 domain-containing protein, partial [Planctomycetota bacterium]
MPLKGELAGFSLPEIFQSLSLNQSNGTLMVSDGVNRTHLLFQSGKVIPLTDIPLEVPGLDQSLVKQKIVDPEILEEIAWDREQGIVDAILRRGIASEGDLLPLVRHGLEEALYDLFLWDNAYFEFKRDEIPEKFESLLEMYSKVAFVPNSILMEAVRRVDEWGRIKTCIPSLKYIFVPREGKRAAPRKVKGAPMEISAIWPHLNDTTNIFKIHELTGAPKIDVCQTVLALIRAEAVQSLPPNRIESEFKKALSHQDYQTCLDYLEFAQELGLEAIEEQKGMMADLLSDGDFINSPEAYRLSGSLRDVNFASLFLALSQNQHEGTLRVEDSEGRKVLYFTPKEIAVLSAGAREQPDFGEILVREKKLTNRELDRALTLAREREEFPGQVLLQEKMITKADMAFAIRKKIFDEIFDIFLWRNARFDFVKNQIPEEFEDNPRVSRLEFTTRKQRKEVMESLSRFREISRDISPRTIFARSEKDRRGGKGVLGALFGQKEPKEEPVDEDPILDLVDGRKRVSDIIRVSQGLGIDICERLFPLVSNGQIVPLPESALKEACESALAENRPEDGMRYCEFALEKGMDRDYFAGTYDDLKARHPDLVEGAQEAKLEGDLESFGLADLFQSLYLNKHSGTLKVSDGVNEKTVYLSKGSICLMS